MNKKDKKLMEQLIADMWYPKKDSLLAFYQERQTVFETIEFTPEKKAKIAPLIDAGLGVLPLLLDPDYDAILDFGIIEAYKTNDMKHLHDALYTYSRLHFPFSRYLTDDEDNEYVMCQDMIGAFAACDVDVIRKYCPENSLILKKGYRMWYVGYNIILGFLYDDKKRMDIGISQAEKALTCKNPQFDAAVIAYLLAIAKLDGAEANRQFTKMMSTYRKSGLFEFHDQFLKVFSLLPHGLYNIAQHYLSADEFSKIIPPEDTTFWIGLAEYQKKVGYSHGEPYISFEGMLHSLNCIYD